MEFVHRIHGTATVIVPLLTNPVPSEYPIRHLIREERQNRGIIQCDDCHLVRARNIPLRSAQIEAPASSREPIFAPSTCKYNYIIGCDSVIVCTCLLEFVDDAVRTHIVVDNKLGSVEDFF